MNSVKQKIKRKFPALYVKIKGIKIFFEIKFPILRVKIKYKKAFKRFPNLKSPIVFSEKIQYLKLFVFPKSEHVGILTDKYGMRNYVERVGLSHILTPLIGVYHTTSEISFKNLPRAFVAKKSNASGYNLIVKDKAKIEAKFFIKTLNDFLEKDFGLLEGERHYSNGLSKIIIEPFFKINSNYKFFVFSGKVELCQGFVMNYNSAESDGFEVGRGPFYKSYRNRSGELVHPEKESGNEIPLPSKYFEMIEIAEKLAGDFPFVRVDLYLTENKIHLGEMTFTPTSGYNSYFKEEWQQKLGNLIDLTELSLYFDNREELVHE